MKTTTTLRILFTLAILVGLATAPSAQTFRWEAGRSYDAQRRAERAIEQARRTVERQLRLAERRVESIQRQVKRRVEWRVSRSRGFNYGDNAGAQVGTNDDPCSNRYNNRDEDYFQHCEVRDSTMPAGPINVDAGNNGGIVIEAWDRNEIRVRAVVQGSARSESRAREVAGQVQVQAGGGRVYSTGPELERREWWSVSYRINVPRKNDLDLRASNGGITIVGVTGNMRFDTTNGGVKLQDVGGRVNGGTRNGGLNVVLNGNKWDGDGLDVETSNGGVTLQIPDGYNAELETRTVNGSLRIDFPITVQGELTSRRGISTTLGSGGPLVRARTTNGGVKISRRM
jgi:Putative adhesin